MSRRPLSRLDLLIQGFKSHASHPRAHMLAAHRETLLLLFKVNLFILACRTFTSNWRL